jgi:hypothetical protein
MGTGDALWLEALNQIEQDEIFWLNGVALRIVCARAAAYGRHLAVWISVARGFAPVMCEVFWK